MRPTLLALMIAALPTIAAAQASRPVVVELFTSQGCSSCPPADRILAELAKTRADVLPLAFHVTYWNRLGWPDPFSFEAATDRQRAYRAISGIGGVYTPQAVVDGTQDVVGSDGAGLRTAITRAAASAVAVALTASRNGADITISVGAGKGRGRLLLVGYDREHRTQVPRGENAGATLVEANIVRSLVPAGEWQGAATELRLALPAGEAHAVLLQAPDGSIIGAARVGNQAS